MELQAKYLNLAETRLLEVYDETIHLDLVNPTDANGTAYNHSIFGNIVGQNKSLFYFKNHNNPNIII